MTPASAHFSPVLLNAKPVSAEEAAMRARLELRAFQARVLV
ncbi:MAG TPA: hypothetical protein PK640_17100 [Verrucomicrobiota bacterium]|nr:hypothetical protein [Verrucomicrobiota bacterium]